MIHRHGQISEDDEFGRIGDIGLWRRILGFAHPYRYRIILAIGLSLIISATALLVPYLIRIAIDRYIVNEALAIDQRLSGLIVLAAILLSIMSLGFVANFFQVTVLEWTGQRIMHAIRQRLFRHLLKLHLAYFHANPVGRLVTRLTNDIQNMHEMFTTVIVTLFNEMIKLVAIVGILLWMNWRLTLWINLIVPVLVVISMGFSRLAREAFRQIRTTLAAINAYLQESLSGMVVIQLFLREKDAFQRFTRLNQDYLAKTFYQIKVFGFFLPLIEVMNATALALIIWYGGSEILRGEMTLGVLVAFITYMRLFFQPLRELSQQYSVVQSAMASAERIFHLLEMENALPFPANPVTPPTLTGRIEFRDVTFSYDSEHPVIHDLSFTVTPGETVAVVGATGAGKTTLINLLERYYDPDRGAVFLDGIELRKLDPIWLREQIGLVMQEVFLIPGSIRDNILLDRDLPDGDLHRIAAASQLSRVIADLPQGLDTPIGEGGMDLSAGQKQLLAFARVLARDPRVLVLDEATANVDSETEMFIEQAIQTTLAGRSSIVIAHRLSTIRRADRIIVLDQGRIVEEGTHATLMEQGGIYYHLQSLQNGFETLSVEGKEDESQSADLEISP
jgi:ATP-binding cassette, subfamily B, multidrug efflux pump